MSKGRLSALLSTRQRQDSVLFLRESNSLHPSYLMATNRMGFELSSTARGCPAATVSCAVLGKLEQRQRRSGGRGYHGVVEVHRCRRTDAEGRSRRRQQWIHSARGREEKGKMREPVGTQKRTEQTMVNFEWNELKTHLPWRAGK